MTLITIILFTWFFTHFEPLQDKLTDLARYIFQRYQHTSVTIISDHLYNVLSCWKCLSFWSTLILTLDIRQALFASFFAWFITKITTKQ